ncbi:MAG: HAD-IA family hydrolase [Gammaproteobacteria bacterium]|jgi:pseudouridine 5'-phosphatase|nr:HAD-IA family hydrolase [Gammaproteobacteria bacterium]MBT4492014.1 HAD-IA family hydrolase [Gammaproteobacteria bacterium]MBT7370977.1 HAD-IA family hydrolase [Gammaproteobacteria bacterium]
MKNLPIDPQAMIFDLDGTLLDTEPLYTQAAQAVLDPYGHIFTMELKRKVMGGDSVRSAQITINEFDLPMTAQEFLDQRKVFLEQLFPDAEEITGAATFLEHVTGLGITTGLATSSHTHLCELKISNRPWRQLLTTIVCGDDSELKRSKPEPDIFLLCASRLDVEPAKVVAFEDSRNGIEAAKAAGMTVIALESPYTTTEDLRDADLIVGDFLALI